MMFQLQVASVRNLIDAKQQQATVNWSISACSASPSSPRSSDHAGINIKGGGGGGASAPELPKRASSSRKSHICARMHVGFVLGINRTLPRMETGKELNLTLVAGSVPLLSPIHALKTAVNEVCSILSPLGYHTISIGRSCKHQHMKHWLV